MERTQLVNLLSELNSVDLPGINFSEEFENKYKEIQDQLKCDFGDIYSALLEITDLYFSQERTTEWKYVCTNLYILGLLNNQLESENEVLSVQQSKTVKNYIQNMVTVGILTKLQPNLPFYVPTQHPEPSDIFLNYNILKCTTLGLCKLLKYPNLRILILPDSLKAILVSLYQIGFCPLRQPLQEEDKPSSLSIEMYNKVMEERLLFLKLLDHLRETIHPGIFVKETMAILYTNVPTWFKKSVSHTLTTIIRSRNGVEHVAAALLDGASNDNTQTWQSLEVFSKLILSCKNFTDFQDNICKQLLGMLDKVTEESLIFERVYIHCTKTIYQADEELGKNIFVRKIIVFFLYFTYKDHKFKNGELLTNKIKQHVRLLHAVFVENNVQSPNLPINLITPVMNVIFRLYCLTLNGDFKSTNTELKDVMLAFLEVESIHQSELFRSCLYGTSSKEFLSFRNDVMLRVDKGDIVLDCSQHSVTYSVSETSECLVGLVKDKKKLLLKLFTFLLNCLLNMEKNNNDELLKLEPNFMTEYVEMKLTVYKLLSGLVENKDIQTYMTEHSGYMVGCLCRILERSIKSATHKSKNFDNRSYQLFFVMLMILQSVVNNSNIKSSKTLVDLLKVIECESADDETKEIASKTLEVLEARTVKGRRMVVEEVESELEKALQDIYDPLLPVRGHGLMTLAKLVEKKDKNAMERKQFVLNIFLHSLTNEDSFIYLSAIGGLAAMADVFPDTILNVLCEEFSDSSRKDNNDGQEVRMKVGESLVRVTKLLGDMAPKYKSLMLNTFLTGAKDEDDLIRASSLSNLGEVCRVLGYKLGTILTEVLVCVHAVITTDKSPQARRAAVTVLRQLLAGLESEMIAFLKEDILHIYRTLKEIYHNDTDDVMRLQAQLALEELNENMRNFVFPNPQLHAEKKIVMLD